MADRNKALLGHSHDKDAPFTPPTTPRQAKMSIDSTLANTLKDKSADTTKKELPADTTVKEQPSMISPLSPDFNMLAKSQEPESNPGLIPDSADEVDIEFDHWDDPDAYWALLPPGSKEAYFLEHFGSTESPWAHDDEYENTEEDDRAWDKFIEDYERHGLPEDTTEPWKQDDFKDWYFMLFRNSEDDCEPEEWFLKVFGARQPWVGEGEESPGSEVASGEDKMVSA